jgi:outer membrane protein assembly factor BamA
LSCAVRWHKICFRDSRHASIRLSCHLCRPGPCGTACKEDGTIRVSHLSFNGVKNVDEGRLKTALATHESSWIPWGKKAYFDRSRFDADLKRIQAFYADRGFPDARDRIRRQSSTTSRTRST